jgi:hypothetical protein
MLGTTHDDTVTEKPNLREAHEEENPCHTVHLRETGEVVEETAFFFPHFSYFSIVNSFHFVLQDIQTTLS